MLDQTQPAPIGHNTAGLMVEIEVRLFNSLTRHGPVDRKPQKLSLPAGATVADIVSRLQLPYQDIFLVLRNGRDVTPGLVGAPVRTEVALNDGDVIAFSGPVPYSYGYGAPVV